MQDPDQGVPTKPDSESLTELPAGATLEDVELIGKLADEDRRPSTRRVCESKWGLFETFCEKRGADPLPASEELVAAYLSKRSEEMSLSTIRQDVAAIRWIHERHGAEDRTDGAGVSRVLHGINQTSSPDDGRGKNWRCSRSSAGDGGCFASGRTRGGSGARGHCVASQGPQRLSHYPRRIRRGVPPGGVRPDSVGRRHAQRRRNGNLRAEGQDRPVDRRVQLRPHGRVLPCVLTSLLDIGRARQPDDHGRVRGGRKAHGDQVEGFGALARRVTGPDRNNSMLPYDTGGGIPNLHWPVALEATRVHHNRNGGRGL